MCLRKVRSIYIKINFMVDNFVDENNDHSEWRRRRRRRRRWWWRRRRRTRRRYYNNWRSCINNKNRALSNLRRSYNNIIRNLHSRYRKRIRGLNGQIRRYKNLYFSLNRRLNSLKLHYKNYYANYYKKFYQNKYKPRPPAVLKCSVRGCKKRLISKRPCSSKRSRSVCNHVVYRTSCYQYCKG